MTYQTQIVGVDEALSRLASATTAPIEMGVCRGMHGDWLYRAQASVGSRPIIRLGSTACAAVAAVMDQMKTDELESTAHDYEDKLKR